MQGFAHQPVTRAVSRALLMTSDPGTRADLLFLEAWEINRPRDLGSILRATQIRRANPDLVAAIERELEDARVASMAAHATVGNTTIARITDS